MHFEPTSLLHLPSSLCEASIFAVFFSRFLGNRFMTKKPYAVIYFAYFLLNATISMTRPEAVTSLTLAVCLIFPLVFYDGAMVQRIICGGLLAAYSFVSEILTMVVTSFIFQYTVPDLRSDSMAFYIGVYVSKALLLCFAFMVARKRGGRLLATSNYHYPLLLLIAWICVGLSFGDMLIVEQSGRPAGLVHLLSELAIAILSVLVFFIFESFQAHALQKERTALVEQQLRQEEHRYRLIDDQNSEIRAIKHDMANHLTSIHKLLAEAQYSEAVGYLDEYIKQASPALTRPVTGKPSVDALITEKIGLAESMGVAFDIKADRLSKIHVSPYHLNIILSNALDNALDACRRLPRSEIRHILLGIKTEGDNLCVRITNSSPPTEIPSDGLPATSKDDKLRHGFGLSAIMRVAEKYGGVVLCEYGGGEFTLYVQLMNHPGGG